jgi:hypothetical protein
MPGSALESRSFWSAYVAANGTIAGSTTSSSSSKQAYIRFQYKAR